MTRLIPVLLLVLAFMIFTVVDIVLMDRSRVRGLPKPAWIALAILLPVVGGVLWLAVGRVRLRDAGQPVRRGPLAPDDDPAFLNRLGREQEMEDRIEQLERELRDLDDDGKPKD
jgi:hypothetical protein